MTKTIVFLAIIMTAIATACSRQTSQQTEAVKPAGFSEVSPQDARAGTEAAYAQFIDVRTPEEYAAGHAARTRNIPLDDLESKLDSIEKNEPVYLICKTGGRSRKAADILAQNGFKQPISITGGTEAWAAAGLPMAQ